MKQYGKPIESLEHFIETADTAARQLAESRGWLAPKDDTPPADKVVAVALHLFEYDTAPTGRAAWPTLCRQIIAAALVSKGLSYREAAKRLPGTPPASTVMRSCDSVAERVRVGDRVVAAAFWAVSRTASAKK